MALNLDQYSRPMGSKKPPGLESLVPQPTPLMDMPPLEVVDYVPPGTRRKLVGGAYDPYERPVLTGDTVRLQRPRTDLRKLSEWIKITKEVQAEREGKVRPQAKPRDR